MQQNTRPVIQQTDIMVHREVEFQITKDAAVMLRCGHLFRKKIIFLTLLIAFDILSDDVKTNSFDII